VRSAGLAAAIEIDGDLLARHPTAAIATVSAARSHAVLSRALRGLALQISPPLIVTEEELRAIVGGIEAAVQETVVPLAA
jgi:adenosylmethionine-8-amino-7-oxononanoate aminotransferase